MNRIKGTCMFIILVLAIFFFASCKEQSSEGLKFEPTHKVEYNTFGEPYVTDEVEYYTVYLGSCKDADIVIPDKYEGVEVRYLNSDSFKDNDTVESFTYNKYIDTIGMELNNCKNLKTVTLGESIKERYATSFEGCESLTDFIVDSKNKTYRANDGVLYSKNGEIICNYPQGRKPSLVTAPASVRAIGAGAFAFCTTLEEVSISEGVTRIEEGAFYECTSLKSISLPGKLEYVGKQSFGNSGLEEIELPNSVTELGDNAFAGCEKLTSVKLSSMITAVPRYAFSGCTSLTRIEIPAGVTAIEHGAFDYCTALESVSTANAAIIGEGAFRDCTSLREITLRDALSEIGEGAFERCTSLQHITLPSGVKIIKNYAFKNCSALKSITVNTTLNDSESYVGNGLFDGCTELCEAEISDAFVSYLPKEQIVKVKVNSNSEVYGFAGFTALKEVEILGACTVGEKAFDSCLSLEKVTLNGVTEIKGGAFLSCTALKEIRIPSSVKEIGDGAFKGCTSLKSIILEDGIEKIGGAFSNCTSLEEITVPSTVTELGSYAFDSCTALKSITILSTKLSTIKNYTFSGCNALRSLTIPEGVTSIESYAFKNIPSLMSLTLPSTVSSAVNIYEAFKLVEIYNPSSARVIVWAENGSHDDWARVIHKDKSESSILDIVGDFAFATIDGVSYLVSYVGSEKEITLPESYKGENYTVRSGAFMNERKIEKITVPNGASLIDVYGFYCTGFGANASSITHIIFEDTEGWVRRYNYGRFDEYDLDVTDSAANAKSFATFTDKQIVKSAE